MNDSDDDPPEVAMLEKAAEWRLRLVDADPADQRSAAAARQLEKLANDPEVVTRHGIALQGLDISSQLVAVIEAIIAEDHEVGVGPVKLQALRRSADQALERGAPADHDQASAS